MFDKHTTFLFLWPRKVLIIQQRLVKFLITLHLLYNKTVTSEHLLYSATVGKEETIHSTTFKRSAGFAA